MPRRDPQLSDFVMTPGGDLVTRDGYNRYESSTEMAQLRAEVVKYRQVLQRIADEKTCAHWPTTSGCHSVMQRLAAEALDEH